MLNVLTHRKIREFYLILKDEISYAKLSEIYVEQNGYGDLQPDALT